MSSKKDKKTAAFICAIIMIAILSGILITILFPLAILTFGEPIAVALLLVYIITILAVIIGVIIALIQRIREINSGEEEESQKY